jgi:hypothetical protein
LLDVGSEADGISATGGSAFGWDFATEGLRLALLVVERNCGIRVERLKVRL